MIAEPLSAPQLQLKNEVEKFPKEVLSRFLLSNGFYFGNLVEDLQREAWIQEHDRMDIRSQEILKQLDSLKGAGTMESRKKFMDLHEEIDKLFHKKDALVDKIFPNQSSVKV